MQTKPTFTVERVYLEDSSKEFWAVMTESQQFPVSGYYEDRMDAWDMAVHMNESSEAAPASDPINDLRAYVEACRQGAAQ